MTHIHLDPIGGIAGDIFVAALLDALPAHRDAVPALAAELSGVACALLPHRDKVLAGSRFAVAAAHGHGHHGHTHWADIRDRLAGSLPPRTAAHAMGIFAALAEAEARVHGIAPDEVAFHEVGAADSVADIVAAACLIDRIGPATWSVAPLPLGGGTVPTAHGILPVPAPATALLLEGFEMTDDGIMGERVTPTGAAILHHLAPAARPASLRLTASGIGFGTRELPGRSNVLRALIFDSADPARPGTHRELAVIAFEVDDQSPEDLAAGLDRIRAIPGVHDVTQSPVFGKKNRIAAHIQVLTAPETLDSVIDACFAETTTIGLRTHIVLGRALRRETRAIEIDGTPVRLKIVDRPTGRTVKAESDDLLARPTHAARDALRRRAEHHD